MQLQFHKLKIQFSILWQGVIFDIILKMIILASSNSISGIHIWFIKKDPLFSLERQKIKM